MITIDDVLAELDSIIGRSVKSQDAKGFFAVLYRKVTQKVKEEIANNYFDDGLRMEKLDVVFAKRYILAYHAWNNKQAVTESWEKAFTLAENPDLLVIQHLLLGMNAHINLDLGIAAAEISKPESIGDLENDFNKINEILASMVDAVQQNLSLIWPMLRKILAWSGNADNIIVDFSLKVARDGAWKFARSLVLSSATDKPGEIEVRDKKVAVIVDRIVQPGRWISVILWLIRLSERGTVSEKIEKLKR